MTSSFDLPGGTKNMKLFRAQAVINSAAGNGAGRKLDLGRGKVLTQWVPVGDSSAESVPARPPSRPADYVGQIIAVAVPIEASSK